MSPVLGLWVLTKCGGEFNVGGMVKTLLDGRTEWRYNPKWDLGDTEESIWLDSRLSFKAKGVWSYMRSKPPLWDFSASRMAHDSKDARKSILGAMKELEVTGYLSRVKLGNGRVAYKLSGNAYVGIEPQIDRSSLEGAEVWVDEEPSVRIESRSDIVDYMMLAYKFYGVSSGSVVSIVDREGLRSYAAARCWMDRTKGIELIGGADSVPF